MLDLRSTKEKFRSKDGVTHTHTQIKIFNPFWRQSKETGSKVEEKKRDREGLIFFLYLERIGCMETNGVAYLVKKWVSKGYPVEGEG